MRIGQHAQPGEPVADLLLRPVAAAADDVCGQALLLERLLEQPQRRGRAHEHHDLARAPAGIDLRAQPVGEPAGLRAPPRLVPAAGEAEPGAELVPALRVGDEQLDRRRAGGRQVEQPQRAVGVLGSRGGPRAAERTARRARARTRR